MKWCKYGGSIDFAYSVGNDATFGVAKLGVYLDSTSGYSNSYTNSDPDPAGKAIPGLRVSTLLTSPFQTL